MKKIYKALVIMMLCSLNQLYAQLDPFHSQYFNNRYQANPAMAGVATGWTANLVHRSQFTGIPGSPQAQNITLDYGGERVGAALNLNLDKAGLQRNLRALATYAYHLPLSDDGKLHFGLSLGVLNKRLNTEDMVGSPNDPRTVAYNQRENYLDGDFGVAYTYKALTVETALPNLRNLMAKENTTVADLSTFYTAVSYKIGLEEGSDIEPKLVYRGIKDMDNILDLGTQVSFVNKQIKLSGMYHSSGSMSFGLLMDYQQKYLIGFSHTAQTSKLANYSNGNFEINLRVKWK